MKTLGKKEDLVFVVRRLGVFLSFFIKGGLFGFREQFEDERQDGASFKAGNTVERGVGLADEFREGADLFVESLGLGAAQIAGLLLAGMERLEGGLDLAAFSLAGDDAEHPPDVLLGLKVLLPFALADDTADEPPADQLTEVLVGVAAADLEVGHDFVSGESGFAGHEEGVNLRHGAVDPPRAAHGTPLGDKLVAGLGQKVGSFFIAHIFNIY